MNFIKNSFRELKHVVWPTKEETRKYFLTVCIVLIVFGLYLFATGSIFKEILFAVKDIISPTNNSAQVQTLTQPEVNITTENDKVETPKVTTTTEQTAESTKTPVEETTEQ